MSEEPLLGSNTGSNNDTSDTMSLALLYFARAPIGAALGLFASSYLPSIPQPVMVAGGVLAADFALDYDQGGDMALGPRKIWGSLAAGVGNYLVPNDYLTVAVAATVGDWLIPTYL